MSTERVPYVLHFESRTVVLGEPAHLEELDALLRRAGVRTRPTYWHGMRQDDPGAALNSVGTDLTAEQFWDRVDAGAFAAARWPVDLDGPLYLPAPPAWLQRARAWEYDPLAPALGAAAPGGWLRAPGWAGTENNDAGAAVGLLQLTDPDSFWVLGSDADLAEVAATAKELAPFRQGFDRLTAYFGPDDRIGCLRLPVVCREPLEDELIVQGVDIEPRFWE
ncbi:hypothetical protein [Kocuria rosea]|uniref:Uncharacterized protein n=1 Tax=Kocuria rosea TaxID=1275 RepID=A0A4R5Y6I7_KOCRO|nr:hypothetical protein [Kocuria rosea]TDL40241.1 hypothetical protein E2R59_14755 [Kocuria rosea]